jgi:hypothetical protein
MGILIVITNESNNSTIRFVCDAFMTILLKFIKFNPFNNLGIIFLAFCRD